jgi:hypothetical protein
MLRHLRLAAVLVLGVGVVYAYPDKPTHHDLAGLTVDLATSNGTEYTDLKRWRSAILVGVVDEDGATPTPRFLQHFYDPDSGLGMPETVYSVIYGGIGGANKSGRYVSALDWARAGMPDARDWKGAIESFDNTEQARLRAYEAVGHVLHLLEDMAQPDHARNRPHPGNYVQDEPLNTALEQFAPTVAVQGRTHVGFERLWKVIRTWPRGEKPHLQTSLKDAFDVVATMSHQHEDAAHLPSVGPPLHEVALGLAPLELFNASAEAANGLVPHSGFVASPVVPALNAAISIGGWIQFRDNLWVRLELNVPFVPTIPWTDADETATTHDPYAEKYIALGRGLLTLAEEHGAGLLRFYDDIVNPPAFVQSVELLQDHVSKYRGDWIDGRADKDGHISSRALSRTGSGLLELGKTVEVRIRFGPVMKHEGIVVHEPVSDVKVWVNSGPDGTPLSVTMTGMVTDPEAPDAEMGLGEFVPSASGTLHIEAQDRNHHLAGRNPFGDVLDSNPATPARATWGNGADGAPYPWEGYEPGADESHAFTVEGMCVTGPLRENLVNAHRWGTWEGTVHYSRTDVGQGRADAATTVSFRAAMHIDDHATNYLSGAVNPVAVVPGSFTGLGRPRGTLDVRGSGNLANWTAAGTVVGVGGAIDLRARSSSEKCSYLFGIDYNDDPQRAAIHDEQFSGETCVDGAIAGTELSSAGGGSLRYEKRWSFHFTPEPMPDHVALLLKHIAETAPLLGGGSNFTSQVIKALEPAMRAAYAAAGGKIPNPPPFMQELGALDKLVRDALDTKELSGDYNRHWEALNRTWLSGEAADGQSYAEHLDGFRKAFEAWRAGRKAIEANIAEFTDTIARRAAPQSPAAAAELRKIAQKLRENGLGAFGPIVR